MKVLVTGATGFIGGNLARELTKQGYRVSALVRKGANLKYLKDLDIDFQEGDLRDKPSLERAMEDCEALFHVAAIYTFWAKDPRLIYETNVQGTANILSVAMSKGVKKVVYTSSESVVGIDARCSLGNENMKSDLSHIPSDYKKSKFMAEDLVFKMYGQGLPVVVVNPTTPIGPYDIKPTPTGKIVTQYLNHGMVACVNTGLNVVDVEDVARGHILALEKGRTGERYLLGNKNLTLREIMGILENLTGIRAPRINIPIMLALCAGYADEFFEGKVAGRAPHIPLGAVKAARKFRHFDCSKAIEELGMPQTPIELSFEKAVNWFRQNGYAR
jgi:dihydroflavonol-4-reductase